VVAGSDVVGEGEELEEGDDDAPNGAQPNADAGPNHDQAAGPSRYKERIVCKDGTQKLVHDPLPPAYNVSLDEYIAKGGDHFYDLEDDAARRWRNEQQWFPFGCWTLLMWCIICIKHGISRSCYDGAYLPPNCTPFCF
jgi:hypothetical protein